MMMCRQGLNPVGPRCAPVAAAAGRVMMPWERPRPRPEGQFNNCEILREGSTAPPSRLNIGQVGASRPFPAMQRFGHPCLVSS